MEKLLADGYCLYFKRSNALKIDGFNFDGLVVKHQKRQNFPV